MQLCVRPTTQLVRPAQCGSPLLPNRAGLRCRTNISKPTYAVAEAAVAQSNGTNGTSVASNALSEAEDLRARFTALQEEVSSYRALNAENARLEEQVQALSKDNLQLNEKVTGLEEDIKKQLSAAQRAAAAQVTAVRSETTALLDAAERNLEDLRQQLRMATVEKDQMTMVMANSARRLAELLYPQGSLPSGWQITTELTGSQGPLQLPPALTGQAAAGAAATPSLLARVAGVVRSLAYYALVCLSLYYATAILRSAPPTLNLEFGLGCVVVGWLLPFFNRLLVPRSA